MLGESQIAHDLGVEQAHRVARGGVAEPRVKLLGDRRAADDRAPLDDPDAHPLLGEITRADEAIMASANDDDVVAARDAHLTPHASRLVPHA
jgi:hypothetical protein